MLIFTGHKIIEQIYQGSYTTIFRGIRTDDNQPVIIKYLNQKYPNRKELSKFRREYELLQGLNSDNFIKVFDLKTYNNSLAIIMEDVGGKSVSEILKTSTLTLKEKLSIAIGMTRALNNVHQHNIIHKDINPSNFIWNRSSANVFIIDFGIATELSYENTAVMDMNKIEGTLHYISPEQTGRMNRSIDSRTDLYSLGITLYELFTNRKPFEANDELELIYLHIAKTAAPPNVIVPELPKVLSDIIMKLLSKTVEKRYQSALGLLHDLEMCLYELNNNRNISSFKIGQNDISSTFQVPQKLYGRKKEIAKMLKQFNNIKKGGMELLLISGYSGIGKTSLVREIQKDIVSSNGCFVLGKFSQYERNIPYNAFIQVFRNLVQQLLLKPQSNLEKIKDRLREALGLNGQIIVDLIPELEQIIGPQQKIENLTPMEAQNRFQLVFRDFIKTFARRNHPLVIFIDDLQWSDLSTLDILKFILTSSDINHLLIIGAYRDNEVPPGHPLLLMLDEAKHQFTNNKLSIIQLSLHPLQVQNVNKLIADTLHHKQSTTKKLTNLVFQKTEGNPFFINQLLTSLNKNGAFTLNTKSGSWDWDLNKIKEVEISDNVVDFLVQRISRLSSQVLKVLQLASCFGNKFSLQLLSVISGQPVDNITRSLWKALKNDLILPLDHNYHLLKSYNELEITTDIDVHFCFHHDRIQQSIYSLIPESDKPRLHLEIGRLLLKHYDQNQQKQQVFDLVHHLNIGQHLIQNNNELIKLINLNYLAGKKAKKSTAYSMATEYFQTSRALLQEDKWESEYVSFFEINREIVESTYLSGSLHKAKDLCSELFSIAKNKFEMAAFYNLEAVILEYIGEKREIILENLRKGLNLFDVVLPVDPEETEQKVREGIDKMISALEKVPVEELHELPETTDQDKIEVINLLFQAIPPAIQNNFSLFLFIELFLFYMAISYGTTPVYCKVFADCGIIIGSILNKYDLAYKFGEASFKLLEKYNANSVRSAVYFIFSTFLSHWRVHYQEGLDYYDLSQKIGLETGNLQYAAYACAHKLYRFLYIGKNLNDCKLETEKGLLFLSEMKAAVLLLQAKIILHFINKLLGSFKDEKEMNSTENELFKEVKESNNLFFLCIWGQINTQICYLMDDNENAEKWNKFTEPYILGGVGHFSYPDYYLYQSLMYLKKWRRSDKQGKKAIEQILAENLDKLKLWSENCPENFSHKYYLVAAELAVIEDEPLETVIELFKKANDAIGTNDFIQIKALINELEGAYWIEQGYDEIGKTFLLDANYLYKQWGSYLKSSYFEKKYINYFIEYDNSPGIKYGRGTTDYSVNRMFLDIGSIIKSMQAISGEIKTKKLLKKLMKIIIENAGAQKGSLLLKRDSDDLYYIEALKMSDSDEIEVLQSRSIIDNDQLCHEIVQYVIKSEESLVLNNAIDDNDYNLIPYINKNEVKSVLCTPIIYQNTCKGVVYLENNLSENVFTPDRLKIIKILSSQASISIENAHLYENLEEKVTERTNQLKKANDQLKKLSLQDPLTKLYNRNFLYEYISKISTTQIGNKIKQLNKNEKRNSTALDKVQGLYLIDLDHFKNINATYGHKIGDEVLIKIAHILKKMVRTDDFIVRWGGEEFLIILNNTDLSYLKIFPMKLLQTIQETDIQIDDCNPINITCSIGASSIPIDLQTPDLISFEQTITISDWALYIAKKNGRNCAAYIAIKEAVRKDSLKEYLTNISKDTVIDDKYVSVHTIRQ